MKENNLKNYGVENPGQMKHVKDKVKQTCLEKYGVENAYQIEKVRQSTRNNLGVDYPFQSPNVREKQQQSMLNKYGFEYPGQVPEIREKMENTTLKNHGVKYMFQDPIAREKMLKKSLRTMYQHGTGVSSKPQRYICNLVNGELCYPVNRCQLDIAFPKRKIYIEYNGGGHYAWDTLENKDKSDMKRYSYLKQFEWKLIKIVCKCDKLYNDDKMLKLINICKQYLLNSKHTWIEINIDKNKIKCKEFEEDI